MSLRHTPRQHDREVRDVRLHDPHSVHHHSLPPPPHLQVHPAHINGNGLPTPPSTNNIPHHPVSLVSPPVQTVASNGVPVPSSIQKLAQANEQTWLLIGRVAEQMGNLEHALSAYENALRHNPMSLSGLTQVAGIARIKENYPKAVEYFQRVLGMQQDNGEVWSALGHCYLMQDDLQKAYAAYQQALYLLPNPKEDPKLWYGIGILYDRYGSLDHAEEAFSSVLNMDKDFDKANEILFRLGIIYKQQGKYTESLDCFDKILRNPPNPLAHADIWFQIGHVFEQQRDHARARDAYERVVLDNPGHAKVLQQLGWLYHQDGSSFQNQDLAIQYLTKSLEADPTDAQSWYLLGRAYMAGQKYNKAYEAYQQAVYRDGRNPTFWCSIGVLYFQINQYRDALDAYSRAIRINPYISEVWFDLGSLYESCNNQISDAIDAYARAAELDPGNTAITQRLQLLKTAQATGGALPAAPGPQDVHPTAYANPMMPPPGLSGPPLLLHTGAGPGSRVLFRTDSRGAPDQLPIPPALSHQPPLSGRSSPGPFRGGPPPPVILDESRHIPSHTPLAPMEVDRPSIHSREPSGPYPTPREPVPRGPAGQGLLLHHPVPQQQPPPEGLRSSAHPQMIPPSPAYGRGQRMPSTSESPPPHSARPRSSGGHMHPGYGADGRPLMGPGPAPGPGRRSPPPQYSRDVSMAEREPGWDRRMVMEHPDYRRHHPSGEYPGPQYSHYQSRPHSPNLPPRHASPIGPREHSPISPRSQHPGYPRSYYDQRSGGPPGSVNSGRRTPPRGPAPDIISEPAGRRYDPRYDAREAPPREYEREPLIDPRSDIRYAGSPEAMRIRSVQPPPQHYGGSESPRVQQLATPAEPKERRRRNTKDKDSESSSSIPSQEPPKKERKRRAAPKRVKDEPTSRETPSSYGNTPQQQASTFKIEYRNNKGSPGPASSNGSGSGSRSVQPSPTGSAPHPPSRVVDEDYDEGVAETLMDLAGGGGYRHTDPRSYGTPASNGSSASANGRVSPQTSLSRHVQPAPRKSPPLGTKRPLSPVPDEENKRSRIGSMSQQRISPHSQHSNSQSGGRPTPTPPTRMSPIPFRQQPTSHSPDRQPLDNTRSFPPSPSLPTMLPPHPRPIGAGLSHGGAPGNMPLSARSPPSNGHGPSPPRENESMHSRSASPPRGAKREIVLHSTASGPGTTGSPGKGTTSPSSSNARPGPPS